MAKEPVFKKPKRQQAGVVDGVSGIFHNLSGQQEVIELVDFNDLIPNSDNPYPIIELEDLIDSIKQYGVQQNLLVQKKGDKRLIIAGHRRYNAVKFILENDNADGAFDHLLQLYSKIIDANEDETLVRLRLHDTNLQARPLNKMSDDEKSEIVTEYLLLIDEAKAKGLQIQGKAVKGKTRDILANMLGVSPRTAQGLINQTKEKPEGGKIAPQKKSKTPADELKVIIKKLSKLEFENTDDEWALKEEIVELLS